MNLELVPMDALTEELLRRTDALFLVGARVNRDDCCGRHVTQFHAFRADGSGLMEKMVEEVMELAHENG